MWKVGKVFLGLVMFVAVSSGVAMAENTMTVNLDGMSTEQIEQIKSVSAKATEKVTEVVEIATSATAKVAETVEKVEAHTKGVLAKVASGGEMTTWVKSMTEAVAGFCTTLNIEVNEFVKTPVGIAITAFAAMKVAGNEISGLAIWLKNFTISSIGYMLFIGILGWNYRRKRGVYKWTNKQTGETTVTAKFDWPEKASGDDMSAETLSTMIHTILFVISTLSYMSIVL